MQSSSFCIIFFRFQSAEVKSVVLTAKRVRRHSSKLQDIEEEEDDVE